MVDGEERKKMFPTIHYSPNPRNGGWWMADGEEKEKSSSHHSLFPKPYTLCLSYRYVITSAKKKKNLLPPNFFGKKCT
jgi:hypothetical protein